VSLRDANTLLIGVLWFLRTGNKADGKYSQKAKVSELHGAFSDRCSFSACRTPTVNLYCLQIPRFRVAAGDRCPCGVTFDSHDLAGSYAHRRHIYARQTSMKFADSVEGAKP
jgi:hypothetical protein